MDITQDPRGALSVQEAARWLGLSTTAVRTLINEGKLPRARIGPGKGRTVIPRTALETYLREHTTLARVG